MTGCRRGRLSGNIVALAYLAVIVVVINPETIGVIDTRNLSVVIVNFSVAVPIWDQSRRRTKRNASLTGGLLGWPGDGRIPMEAASSNKTSVAYLDNILMIEIILWQIRCSIQQWRI